MSREVFFGFDEAGYGPILGPVCVGGLRSCVPEYSKLSKRDSKKIHKKKGSKALLDYCSGFLPGRLNSSLKKSFQRAANKHEPWTAEIPFPEFDGVGERDEPDAAIVCVGVEEFNRLIDSGMNKADLLIELYRRVLLELISLPLQPDDSLILSFDRLGGRKAYGEVLEDWGFTIVKREENEKLSRYEGAYKSHRAVVSFSVKGDELSEWVAGASCLAKLSRELVMESFNRWWAGKIPEIKPTAGYYTDGIRFLEAIESTRQALRMDLNYLRRKR